MITNKEITEFLVEELKDDIGIKNYCENELKSKFSIFVGVDVNNAPTKDDMPLLLIEPLIKNIGDSEKNFDYEMLLKVLIKGFDKPKVNENVVIYDGIYEVESLGGLIVDKLQNSFSKTNLDTYEIGYYSDEINSFPIYTGTILINLSVPNVIGCEKLKFTGD